MANFTALSDISTKQGNCIDPNRQRTCQGHLSAPEISNILLLCRCNKMSWLEKAREFAPFGHAGFDPSGIIRLTP